VSASKDVKLRAMKIRVLVLLAIAACSDTTPVVPVLGTPDAAAPKRDAEGVMLDARAPEIDGGRGEGDAACEPKPPAFDGGNPCGALAFGQPVVNAGPVNLDGGTDAGYLGGMLLPGIYDAVVYERASGGGGSWRETFVVDGAGQFTRTRVIDTGGAGGPGPTTYRAGTYTLSGSSIQLKPTCAFSGDAGVDAGTDTLPYEALPGTCGASTVYRFGATGLRITLKRRE
jgi:hypothetical protein